MHHETQARRRRVYFEQRELGQGIGTGFLVRQIDSDIGVLREHLPEVEKTCREVYLSDGHLITSEFIRSHLKEHVFATIAAREGAIRGDLELLAQRTGVGATQLTSALHHLVREIGRLRAILSNRYEAEAIELAKQEARCFAALRGGRKTNLEGPRDALTQVVVHTSDAILDGLLERARSRFLSPESAVRRESLETLWDVWERLKSLEPGNDKRESTEKILDRASPEPRFRGLLEVEARELTKIGNTFMIRHMEVDKVPIVDEEHVEFLFQRMFALIRLLLQKTNRGG
jgi:hypothetical protein